MPAFAMALAVIMLCLWRCRIISAYRCHFEFTHFFGVSNSLGILYMQVKLLSVIILSLNPIYIILLGWIILSAITFFWVKPL